MVSKPNPTAAAPVTPDESPCSPTIAPSPATASATTAGRPSGSVPSSPYSPRRAASSRRAARRACRRAPPIGCASADATAFADARDQAPRLARLRLTTIAFERAVKRTVRETWREGERVAETRAPSDRLLIFLLGHLLPRADRMPSRLDAFDANLADPRGTFAAALDRLADHDVAMVPVESRTFFSAAPGDPREDW